MTPKPEHRTMYQAFKQLPQWLRLAIIFPLLFLNGFLLVNLFNYFGSLLTYLVIANLLAFLLELVINFLIERGIKRGFAIAIVLLSSLLIVIITTAIVLPLFIEQLTELLTKAPQWLAITEENLKKLAQSRFFNNLPIDVGEQISNTANNFYSKLQDFASQALGILIGTLNNLLNTVIIIILTIFILIGGDQFWQGILSWLPQPWDSKIAKYTAKTFKDYFFARLVLAAIFCVACTIVLYLLRVPYAFLFSFILALCSFIPIIGGIIGLVLTIFVFFKGLAVGLKFFIATTIINQIMDNVVAPRLMGEKVGLNPIWLLISLFVGGQIAGILGLILAVPVASVVKQVIDDLRDNDKIITPQDSLKSNEFEGG